ncbi:MAG: Gx transporter family protein [Schaedlerella sp.]|nr:Gx transporter family protein [Schaedlerella sp.]
MSKKVAVCGVLVALAMIFSYIEVLIPFNFGIPGMKLGLANLVIVIGFYFLKPHEVLLISLVRILLIGWMFGNGMSIIYSVAGGMLSFVVMLLLKKYADLSIIGVSVAGGVFHNVGQLAAAAAVLNNTAVFYYFPVLLVSGVVTGSLIGILSKKVVRIVGTEGRKMI